MIFIWRVISFLLHSLALCLWPVWIPVVRFIPKRKHTVSGRMWWSSAGVLKKNRRPVIWIHALSVGEVLSAAPVIEELKRQHPEFRIVLTASTHTGFQTAEATHGHLADQIFYAPFDFPGPVSRAFRHINPAVLVIVETDIWPGMIFEARRRRVPVVWINVRISPSSYKGYRRLKWMTSPVFNAIPVISAQTETDAERLRGMGVNPSHISVDGNIKFDRKAPDFKANEIESFTNRFGFSKGGRLIVCGSTHPSEEEIIADAFLSVRKQFPDALLVIAPRDPARSDDILSEMSSQKCPMRLLNTESSDLLNDSSAGVIINQLGVLMLAYFLADICFVGGSLMPFGGHNPLEPAILSKPVTFGPHMTDFDTIATDLIDAGAASTCRDADELADTWLKLLEDSNLSEKMGASGRAVCASHAGATKQVAQHISMAGRVYDS